MTNVSVNKKSSAGVGAKKKSVSAPVKSAKPVSKRARAQAQARTQAQVKSKAPSKVPSKIATVTAKSKVKAPGKSLVTIPAQERSRSHSRSHSRSRSRSTTKLTPEQIRKELATLTCELRAGLSNRIVELTKPVSVNVDADVTETVIETEITPTPDQMERSISGRAI